MIGWLLSFVSIVEVFGSMITYPQEIETTSSGKPVRSPWLRFNLRRNPFGECTREERVQMAIIPELDCNRWLIQCAQPLTAIEFLGRCGRGKTTRLLKLHWMAKQSHYVYLGEDGHIPSFPFAQPLMIDEAQRLPRGLRNRVLRSGVPLVLGTHRSLARSLRHHGYQVVTYRIGRQNDAGFVFEYANRRIEAARYRPGTLPRLGQTEADRLVRKFRTNVRAIEASLYEDMQSMLQASSHSNSS